MYYTLETLSLLREELYNQMYPASTTNPAPPWSWPYKEETVTSNRDDKTKADENNLRRSEEWLRRWEESVKKLRDSLTTAEAKRDDARAEYLRAKDAVDRAEWPEDPAARRAGFEYVNLTLPSELRRRGYTAPVVVTFTRHLSMGDYTYAAVHVGGQWYVTGNKDHNGEAMTWDELMEFAGDYGRYTLCVSGPNSTYVGSGL